MVPHPIQPNKGEKKNVGGDVDLIKKGTILIHCKPQLLALIRISRVPIAMHMCQNPTFRRV